MNRDHQSLTANGHLLRRFLYGRSVVQWLSAALVAILLSACDMAATPLVPTPTPFIATPQILGVTVEPVVDASPIVPEAMTPTAVPVDETLPAWTVMIYSSADTPAWSYAWDSLNQMEAAGASGQVQVLAAVDWPQISQHTGSLPARYVIRGNNDPTLLTSEEAVGAEETNFGDPQVLADFITWSLTTYPANRYALILDGYGGGRHGCCLDMDPAGATSPEALSLADIEIALTNALVDVTDPTPTTQSLDVVAFSGSMMADLEVFQAVAPFADFAVASAAPVPASGWNYETLLGALYADPWQDGRSLTTLMTTDYANYHRQLIGNEFVAMSAVDLAQITAVTTAVETLALALNNGGTEGFGSAADARRGAQSYGAILSGLDAATTNVDLGHAMAILAERSTSVDVAVSARAVAVSAAEATAAHNAGNGLPFATGISIYWPVVTTAESLAAEPALPNWFAFLTNFGQYTAALNAPLVAVLPVGDSAASATSPLLIQTEVFAQQLDSQWLITTQAAESGGQLLLQAETIPPPLVAAPDASLGAFAWPDGRHAAQLPWNASSDYLYDAAGTSSPALIQLVDQAAAGGLLGVSGTLQQIGSLSMLATVLEFPPANAVPAHVWHLADAVPSLRFVHELAPGASDQFTPQLYQSADGGQWQPTPGNKLTFDDVPALYRSTRPLDNGSYQVGLSAAVLGPNRTSETVEVSVNQTTALAGYSAYTDAQLGVGIVYPESWVRPSVDANSIRTNNIDGTTNLQIRVVDNWTNDAAALLADAVANLGGITTLFEDTTSIAGRATSIDGGTTSIPAVRMAYGYPGADGRIRTGILTAFVADGRGTLIDLDGLQGDDAELIAIADDIAANWRFVPTGNPQTAEWLNALLFGYDVSYPPGMGFEDLNGWYRFVNGDHFVAVRVQPVGRTSDEALTALLTAAGEGVAGFQMAESAPIYLGGGQWLQGQFTYENPAGATMNGIILTRPDAENELAVWSEWPADDQATRNEAIALAVAAAMQRNDSAGDQQP